MFIIFCPSYHHSSPPPLSFFPFSSLAATLRCKSILELLHNIHLFDFGLPTRRLTGSPRYAHPAFSISSQLCSCCLPSQPRSLHSLSTSPGRWPYLGIRSPSALFTLCPLFGLIHTPNHPSFPICSCCHCLSSASSNHIRFLRSNSTSTYITHITTFANAACVYLAINIDFLDAKRFDKRGH